MGTGKTFIAAAAAHAARFKQVLVLCPPHLTRKWKREVEETIPGARAVIVTSITGLERLRFAAGSGPLFAVMSRERAKLSYRWSPAVVERWAVAARSADAGRGDGRALPHPLLPPAATPPSSMTRASPSPSATSPAGAAAAPAAAMPCGRRTAPAPGGIPSPTT